MPFAHHPIAPILRLIAIPNQQKNSQSHSPDHHHNHQRHFHRAIGAQGLRIDQCGRRQHNRPAVLSRADSIQIQTHKPIGQCNHQHRRQRLKHQLPDNRRFGEYSYIVSKNSTTPRLLHPIRTTYFHYGLYTPRVRQRINFRILVGGPGPVFRWYSVAPWCFS